MHILVHCVVVVVVVAVVAASKKLLMVTGNTSNRITVLILMINLMHERDILRVDMRLQ